MATITWIAGSAGNWSSGINWSGGVAPGASDDVVFDGTGTGNCTVDVSPSIASINIQSGYTGVFSDANFDFTVSGNVTLSGGNSSYGTGTWTVGGNWDFNSGTLSGTNVTFNSGSSTFESLSRSYGTITVNSGVTLTTQSLGGSIQCGTLTANGTYSSSQTFRVRNFINTGASGEITGTGTILFDSLNASPWGVGTNAGLISIANLSFPLTSTYPVANVSGSISSANVTATYGGSGTAYFRPTADVTFLGNFTLSKPSGVGTAIFDAATNNPNITFGGDVALSQTTGTVSWSAGTGTITLDNTAAQAINFNGQTVEAVIVSNASTGAITLGANFTTPYVHDCNNLIDLNGFTITETGTDPSPCVSYAGYYLLDEPFKRL